MSNDTTYIKAIMTFESKDPDELQRILDHHMEYLIDFDDCTDIITSVSDVQSYDTSDKRDITKLTMIASILEDILNEEPSDEDLDNDDDAIAIYDELHNLKQALQNKGYM